MSIKPLPTLSITTGSFSHELLGSIEFRNWTLGEQQNSLFKKEDKKEVFPILVDILGNCVTKKTDAKGKDYSDVLDMPLVMGEVAFTKIREISVSETQDYIVECENPDCIPKEENGVTSKHRHIVTADLSKAFIKVPEGFKDFITIGKYKIGVKLPSIRVLGIASGGINDNDLAFISDNVSYIIDDDGEVWDFNDYDKESRLSFIHALPPSFTVAFIENWKKLPSLRIPCEGKCKHCENVVEKDIIGITSLFTG